ncbi:hypothetical protein BDN72DRAFT_857743 [Pluteus cervinus]|uniref:Uncharacterized protein n=1 Tax=Pluteus cervinus TaxID=181527 RepID=A0ACD3AUH3_9AGAR|nr:hypothetical protein BDN72DRAFT_857743 [Pluteus cervinus]
MATVADIPNEILEHIFEFSHCVFDDTNNCNSVTGKGSPWTLTWVDHRWREVAISAPQLWSYFYFSRLDQTPESLLELCLERSRNYPLTIKFCNNNSFEAFVLETLIEHCDRWKSFTMNVKYIDMTYLDDIRDNIPQLEYLNLTISSPASDPIDLSAFCNAPRLTDVALNCPSGSVMPLPWRQLRSFEGAIDKMTHEFLGECPNLQSYHLRRHHHKEHPHSEGLLLSPRRHRNLRNLNVKFMGELDFLQLPTLESLTILAPSEFTTSSLTQFVVNSNCQLTHFSLGYLTTIDVSDLIQFFHLTPFLETLALSLNTDHQRDVDALFSALSYPTPVDPDNMSSILLPFLEVISLTLYPYTPRLSSSRSISQSSSSSSSGFSSSITPVAFSHDSFLSMLETRWFVSAEINLAQLIKCTVQTFEKIDKDFIDRTRRVEEDGMEFRLLRVRW